MKTEREDREGRKQGPKVEPCSPEPRGLSLTSPDLQISHWPAHCGRPSVWVSSIPRKVSDFCFDTIFMISCFCFSPMPQATGKPMVVTNTAAASFFWLPRLS